MDKLELETTRLAEMVEEWWYARPQTRQARQEKPFDEEFFEPWRNSMRWHGACEER